MLAHAETNRQPEQLPYPAETVIPFLQLTEDQYALLQTIYTGLLACQPEIDLPGRPTLEALRPVMHALNYDYPELMAYYGVYRYRYVGEAPRRITSVLPEYCMTRPEAEAAWQRVMQVVTRVVTDCGAEIVRPRPRKASAPVSQREQLMQLWTRPSETVMQITRSTQLPPSLERIWLSPVQTVPAPAPQPRPAGLSGKLRNVWLGKEPRTTAAPAGMPGQSDMARRAERLHDALVACTRYRSRKESEDLHVLTAKGALLDGLSNCVGYAKTLMLLYRTAGIPCGYVHGSTGENRTGEPTHAWNIACIDGQYTQIDATWSDQDKAGYVTHFYYGLSDAQMRGDHVLAPQGSVPPCSDHSNWHKAHNCYITSYKGIFSAIGDCMRKGMKIISLRFASKGLYELMLKDVARVVTEYNGYCKPGERIKTRYNYTYCTEQLCLLINLMPVKP